MSVPNGIEPAPANTPMPQYRLKEDYPLLYEKSLDFDFAERLGGCSDPLMAEIDKAMRELWESRRSMAGLIDDVLEYCENCDRHGGVPSTVTLRGLLGVGD